MMMVRKFTRGRIDHYPRPPLESGWKRVNYYAIAYTPPGRWHWFATITVQEDGRFLYEEPGNGHFDLKPFDNLAQAMGYVHPRWEDHQVSIAYVDEIVASVQGEREAGHDD